MDNFLISTIDDISIVKVDIAAATQRDSQGLWDKMAEYSIFDQPKIIIDLTPCTFVDSTFIGMIVKIFRKVNETHGLLKLAFPQITNLESFRVIGITKIVECFNSLEDAIESFNPSTSVQKIAIDQKTLYYTIADGKK
ncbi:MAG: STAS domain-containing protein [Ignavibacteriaceae bacterium]|jgi:anti-anti-sigma regulatory factor|nr:STAS domain-containing protein [Ignavibacteriaceae bacterium]